MNSRSIHLPGLNGLRAIMVLTVVFSHITTNLQKFRLNPNVFGTFNDGEPKGLLLASLGVSAFFALSGFLITYLLLLEKKKNEDGKINVKYFYVRRILRIWPLYYLYLAICMVIFVIDGTPYTASQICFYVFFCANIPFILSNGIAILIHYWSLGVEEQFYLFWPWVVRQTNKHLLQVSIIGLLFLLSLKLIFRYYLLGNDESLPYKIIDITRFQCMLAGVIGAILYTNQTSLFLKVCNNKITQAICWGILLFYGLNFHIASVLDSEFVSIVTVFLIIGQITVNNRLVNLENKPIDFIGKISYGIYIIHPLIIRIFIELYRHNIVTSQLNYFVLYTAIPIITVGVSWVSYQFFEKKFLTLKTKYTIIPSVSSKE
jgi:peptidoglycan/LPS O-acetylase OafA/YrhL